MLWMIVSNDLRYRLRIRFTSVNQPEVDKQAVAKSARIKRFVFMHSLPAVMISSLCQSLSLWWLLFDVYGTYGSNSQVQAWPGVDKQVVAECQDKTVCFVVHNLLTAASGVSN